MSDLYYIIVSKNHRKSLRYWSKVKIDIELKESPRFCKKGDVWWCSLGQNIGTEQNGSGDKFQRPVLVLKIFNHKTILIIPLTTSDKTNIYRKYVGIIRGKHAKAIICQLRTISSKRLTEKITTMDKKIFKQTKKEVRKIF